MIQNIFEIGTLQYTTNVQLKGYSVFRGRESTKANFMEVFVKINSTG